MNSYDDIWQSVLDELKKTTTPTAMKTWLEDCRPIDIDGRRLVITTTSEFKRNILLQRFEPVIRQTLADIFSCEFEVVILVGDEVNSYLDRKNKVDTLPEALAYTFDRFIVGQSNKFAHGAAIAVAENPGKVYNPLFIYGNSGLGKTHLLYAIGQAIRERDPSVKIGFVKGDDFTNEMVKSLREHTEEEFRTRYRNVDLFLVDDIQFISGKLGVQQEFFHTFDSIYLDGHQIVITSDRPPKDMATLEDRLRSRFESGLMADIQPPDLETRMAITRNKAQSVGLILPDDVVNYIAENLTTNIRQIEGVIHKLTAYRQLEGNAITVASVKRAIADVIQTGVYIPTPDVIIQETGRYFGIEESEIRGDRRTKNTALARHVAIYLVRTLTNLSLEDTGAPFNRNHSTVLTSIRKVEELIKTDNDIAGAVRDITSNINSLHDR